MAMTSGAATNPGPAPHGAQGARSHLIAGTRIVGDISAPGLLEIDGHVDGRVSADSVVIEERGTVNGEVHAAAIGVKGTVTGHLTGKTIRVHATAHLSGTIRYESLIIDSGSDITATCERSRAG